ncbi:MAG: hypothetical protein LBT32_06835 [Peptococcaceae bacterium]|nr:hypothetical protein [Peptococcaceae bacterium]
MVAQIEESDLALCDDGTYPYQITQILIPKLSDDDGVAIGQHILQRVVESVQIQLVTIIVKESAETAVAAESEFARAVTCIILFLSMSVVRICI